MILLLTRVEGKVGIGPEVPAMGRLIIAGGTTDGVAYPRRMCVLLRRLAIGVLATNEGNQGK